MIHDVWVEVDIGALKHNLMQVRNSLASNVGLMAVVKANGFGHGYVEPSRAFLEAGADYLAVTRLDEALTIRAAGIAAPLLLFAPIQPENAEAAVAADLDLTVTNEQLVRAISAAAVKLGKTARVHVKVDSGMGRLGLRPEDTLPFFMSARECENVQVAGIYTHFATAAERSAEGARKQFECFHAILQELEHAGVKYGLAHAANSAGLLRIPESHLDMVRPGTLLYGQYPSSHVPRTLDLRPTWKLKARICEIKDVPRGRPIGYSAEYVTRSNVRAAVIPVGFADGLTLAPEGPIYRQSLLKFAGKRMRRYVSVEIDGRKAPVLGRVAMQLTVIDITNISGVKVGDEVVVPAMRIPTSALIPRIYVDSSA